MSLVRAVPLLTALLFYLAAPVAAFFRLPCTSPLVRDRVDPIVNPGTVAGHLHTIMGGNGFSASMTFQNARASTCSSCRVRADMSNYWVPSLYYRARNGSFIPVEQVGGALIYYLHRTDPGQNPRDLVPFPEGFRMLAGDTLRRSYSGSVPEQAVNFTCLGTNRPETLGLPNYNCPSGLRAQIFFPSCWNGRDVDSPDHKSHIVYPSVANGGRCPDGFKFRTMSLFYEVLWAVDKFKDMWYGDTQPFVFSNGDPTGYGYHGDFVNGWEPNALKSAITNCLDGSGDINRCQPLLPLIPDSESKGCILPRRVAEPIDGVLDRLPGCNPVTSGPARASPQYGCGAPTSLGEPERFYTDLTASKRWHYVGCGKDIAFTARTLSGASTASDDMTVGKCVDFCAGRGFTYAGLEYSRECYCGNRVAEDRAPVPGVPGDCRMRCAGNSNEYCGGPQRLSLYKKCDSYCTNAS